MRSGTNSPRFHEPRGFQAKHGVVDRHARLGRVGLDRDADLPVVDEPVGLRVPELLGVRLPLERLQRAEVLAEDVSRPELREFELLHQHVDAGLLAGAALARDDHVLELAHGSLPLSWGRKLPRTAQRVKRRPSLPQGYRI